MWITRGINSGFNYPISLTKSSMRGLKFKALCPRGDLNPSDRVSHNNVLMKHSPSVTIGLIPITTGVLT